jgi:hypothetical protein
MSETQTFPLSKPKQDKKNYSQAILTAEFLVGVVSFIPG